MSDTKYFSIQQRADGWYWEDAHGKWEGPCETRTQAVDEQTEWFSREWDPEERREDWYSR